MWIEPVAVARFLIGTLLLSLLRLPFPRAAILPGFVEYQPGFALLPLLGAMWGAAGCWAAVASSLLTDGWMELSPSLRLPRAVGMFLAARCGQCLLVAGGGSAGKWAMAWDFTQMLPSAAIAALCVAGAAGLYRYYPFVYVSTLSLLQHLFFLMLFLPLLSRAIRFSPEEWGGRWPFLLPVASCGRASRAAGTLIWVGAVGGWLTTYLVSGWLDGIWPRTIYIIGTVPSGWAPRLALPFILIAALGCFWPIPGQASHRGRSSA